MMLIDWAYLLTKIHTGVLKLAKKPTVSSVASGFTSGATIDSNFEALRDAFSNTVSRDGSTPNTMDADFDMNNNDINNAKSVNTTSLYLNGQLVSVNTDLTGAGSDDIGYISSGANSVARTVLAKLDDIVSVKDFGALADGTTDDLASINKALTASTCVLFPSGTYRVSNLPSFSGHSLIATDAILLVDSGQTSASTVDLQDAGGLTFQGAATTSTTISSISSVSGSAGAYTVVGTLASSTGINVGDVIKVDSVTPGTPVVPGAVSTRPEKGQLNLGFYSMDYLTTSGTTATVSETSPGAGTFLAVGDLIVCKGQVRRVASNLTSGGFTLDAAFEDDLDSIQYWYYLQDSDTGTVTVSGTTVTGVGTTFLSDANVGDLIFINGSGARRISAIGGDTSMTIETAITVSSGSVYGILSLGELHEGAWVVTGVAGNQVSWTNTGKRAPPPVNNVDGGAVTVIPTQLSFTGSGFVVKTGSVKLTDISLKGDGSTSDIGLNQKEEGFSSNSVLSGSVAIANFGYGIWAHGNSYVYAPDISVSGNTTRGINITEGAKGWLNGSVVSGNSGIGVFVGTGSYARLADLKVISSSSFGVRREVGSSVWMDFGYLLDNGSAGMYDVGGVLIHMVGTRVIGNNSNGFTTSNGSFGRVSGALFLCNTSNGMSIAQASIEAHQTICLGNGGSGVSVIRSIVGLEDAGIGYNTSIGLQTSGSATATIDRCHIIYNGSVGINASGLCRIEGDSPVFEENNTLSTNLDIFVAKGAVIYTTSATGTYTSATTKNQVQPDGQAIYDDTASDLGILSLSVGAGEGVNLIQKFSEVNNLGTVAANSSASFSFTATGAATTTSVALVNCNVPVAGLVYSAQCDGVNQITVTASNVTTGGIAAGNKTYTVVLLDF